MKTQLGSENYINPSQTQLRKFPLFLSTYQTSKNALNYLIDVRSNCRVVVVAEKKSFNFESSSKNKLSFKVNLSKKSLVIWYQFTFFFGPLQLFLFQQWHISHNVWNQPQIIQIIGVRAQNVSILPVKSIVSIYCWAIKSTPNS